MIDGYTPPLPPSPGAAPEVEKTKAIAILAYFIFFLPLLVARESTFAMFHANQGLNLLIFFIIVNIVGSFVPIIGWFIIGPLGNIVGFILLILGIVNAAKGQMKPLPLVGKFNFLKI